MRKISFFTASWCKSCKNVKPFVEQAKERGVEVEYIDVELDTARATKESVTSLPTVKFYEDGQFIAEMHGASQTLIHRIQRF